ncbi:MAG: hypothetical protein KGL04_03370 [Elusimicrobia bacterium]|nr:hypothetical protein [Elusimicrobiota bacterium]
MTRSGKLKRGLLSARWAFLAGFLFYAAEFVFSRPAAGTAAKAAICGLGWLLLSWKKMRELDAPAPR